jgi:hypothetical protein
LLDLFDSSLQQAFVIVRIANGPIQTWCVSHMLQALNRRNVLALAVGAAATVWLYDAFYEEHLAQHAAQDLRSTASGEPPPRVPDV